MILSDLLLFGGLVISVVVAYMLWKLWGINWVDYFSTKEGKGILKGIILAPVVIVIIALIFSFFLAKAHASGTWFNDASVFAGIDTTKNVSPQCESNTVDDRGTSNMGAKLNIWQSHSSNIRLNSKYTHHSCVLGRDRNSYDALGLELEWRVWQRSR